MPECSEHLGGQVVGAASWCGTGYIIRDQMSHVFYNRPFQQKGNKISIANVKGVRESNSIQVSRIEC